MGWPHHSVADQPDQQFRFGSGGWPGRLDALETEVRRTRRERTASPQSPEERMTPTPTGQVIPTANGRDLVLERVLPGSIDEAWASITESDRLARWFCTWTGEPRESARTWN